MKVYSFGNTVMLINGVEITGFAEGDDVIKVERLTDSASHKIGAGGSMMVSLSSDKSGHFVFKLQQTSKSNKYLSNLLSLQEGGAKTFVPIAALFQDTYRNDMASGTTGYLKKAADMSRGAEATNQEWEVIVERLDMLLGDPAFAGLGG